MRKPIPTFFLIPTLLLFLIPSLSYPIILTLSNTPTQVYFSPHGGCSEAIIKEIDRAKAQILVQAYSFTSQPIAKALLAAHTRGVNVQTIVIKVKNLNLL
jgi:phosphatidylserine/phosphatidylglycerophosphate/cardiolipin synthase-like enzyme